MPSSSVGVFVETDCELVSVLCDEYWFWGSAGSLVTVWRVGVSDDEGVCCPVAICQMMKRGKIYSKFPMPLGLSTYCPPA